MDNPHASGSASNHSRNNGQGIADMDIKIISEEEIKPASSTPPHLSTYKLSIFYQLMPHIYSPPFVFFYPNNQKTDHTNIITERMICLKQSLSKTLVSFYFLAGRVKDNLEIECNDEGVYYVEARVKIQLSDFLKHPENQSINQLLPVHPGSVELLSKTYPIMIQVSMFECGGIAIGLYTSHKVIDGSSVSTFMKAWSARASGSSEQINPSFISSSVFPLDPNLFEGPSLISPPPLMQKYVTRRLVFGRSALDALKTKAASNSSYPNPSSVTTVMGILWQLAMAASKVRCGVQRQSVLQFAVDLRPRRSPPLSPHSFGNIFWGPYVRFVEDDDPELQFLVKKIRNAIDTINHDFTEGINREPRSFKLIEHAKYWKEAQSNSNIELFSLTSLCNRGFYEADFGWGKPIWIAVAAGDTDLYGLGNLMVLMDTRSGGGIEAWVTMKEEDMAIFEKNLDILTFASSNLSLLPSKL